jgi:transposase-like protein
MVGLTSVEVKESLGELAAQLRQAKTLKDKERLQVLYWLKQDKPPSSSAIAKATGKHRNTLQTWLMQYRNGGVEAMLEVKKSGVAERGYESVWNRHIPKFEVVK